MKTEVSEAREMNVPPAAVYGIIADYRNGHPRILPKPFFGELTVEEGGVGAGTRIRFTMNAMGRVQEVWAIVEEPDPGRVLVERYPDTGGVTTFTVEPRGAGCRVTIHTTFPARGIKGLIEKIFAPAMLRKVFREELELLEQAASGDD